ncbi:MAG: AMP phosphorylase [Methanocalculus sp.]|uniref:AMP phosphorylase n=1 Tax=Methanocalculus sp. TaxID=2004547 RepID=UPI00272586F7|nr:AMP phosphorylase [Methanocalculus sp.]MDO9539273.1 AMP phosphorylase [Methanocalculus sp.]
MVRLSGKVLDIEYRGLLLNRDDARTIGVLDGDRVEVINEEKKTVAQAFVTTTATMLPQGTAGVYQVTNRKLQLEGGEPIEVRAVGRPASIDFIKKKMDGGKLTMEETQSIVREIVDDTLSPGEISAYLVGTYINGLDMDEIEYLTRATVATGEKLSFASHPIVDKHSIGGVPGNKITLLVVPIIMAAGLKCPKTSSRAITGAGGTADLMEALAPVSFSASELQTMTEKVGGAIVWGGATNIAPADDKIILYEYPLKIDPHGQMLASVMAKKFAVGADLVVIDIPVGRHAKVTTVEDGRRLARDFMELGDRLGMRVECALTYGETPIGRSIGVNLEVAEALAILKGSVAPDSLIQKSAVIAGIALEMAGKVQPGTGTSAAIDLLTSGKADAMMQKIIEVQGGDPTVKPEDLPFGEHSFTVNAPETGYVVEMHNRALITIARAAGSPHDHGAGILLHKKQGQHVKKGDPIFTIYANRSWRLQKALEEARRLMPIAVEGMLIDRVPGNHWRSPMH